MKGFLLFLLLFPLVLLSQNKQLDAFMQGEVFIGAWPKNVQYNAFGDTIFYSKYNELDTVISHFAIVNGKSVAIKNLYPTQYGTRYEHPNHQFFLWKTTDAIFLGNYKSKKLKLLLAFSESVGDIQWIGSSNSFAYRIGKTMMVYANGTIQPFVQWKSKSEKKNSKEKQWLNDQQEMFDVLKLREQQKQNNTIHSQQKKSVFQSDVKLKDNDWTNFTLSNNQTHLWITKTESQRDYTSYSDYVTYSGYTTTKSARSKVGTEEIAQTLFRYDKSIDSLIEINFSFLPGIHSYPHYLNKNDSMGKPKSVYIHGPILNPYNDWGIVELKSNDNKDRWLVLVHPTEKTKIIDHQHDDAWIGGPGITGWNMVSGNVGWFDKGNKVWFQSEKTGYSHVYAYDLNTSNNSQLTKGKFEVREFQLSKDGNSFYFSANKIDPGVRNFYKLNWRKTTTETILEGYGNYEVIISPDEMNITGRFSTMTKPWEVFTAKNKAGTKADIITSSQSEVFKNTEWIKPEIIRFKAQDGEEVPARIYKPKKSNGAAVIFVHGAGYLQNAHHWWSAYFREYMFHQMLRDEGYTVLDIDYRASEGYGRDWRTAIYRHMGGLDLRDQVDGRQYLIDSLNIDPDRVGIYGGSYGGFITLMALLTTPGKFKCGAAIRSVTDWAHYNHPYTSNILNTPVLDSLAYHRSSPINFADNLEDRLLMLHGVLDDNVQYQDILRLAQRFIELGKKNWELASYPVEAHGFKHPASWIDEYSRIYEMFKEELSE